MHEVESIGDAEIILRRIPPSRVNMDSTRPREHGGLRATSRHMSPRPSEGLSCTRLKTTSPRKHLEDLTGHDPSGWMISRLIVSEVRSLGLKVVHVPTDQDLGHCEIQGEQGSLEFPNSKARKLAKLTRILSEEEVSVTEAGDQLP